MENMEPITLRPDAKGRITLGKLAEGVSSFRVTCDDQQRIVLEPYSEIPARERWLYQNGDALKSVLRGLAESARGEVHHLGDFSRYADDDAQ